MKFSYSILLSIFRLILLIILGTLMMRQGFAFQIVSEAVSANTPPTISAVAPITLRAGSKKVGLVIASTKDRESPLGELKVSVTPLPGIIFSNVTNNGGLISADIEIDCSVAPANKSVKLTVSDGLLTGTAFLTITVADLASINLGQYNNITAKGITPISVIPTGLSISTEANVVLSIEANGIITPTIDQATGAINFPGGIASGSYLVIVRASNNCGLVASRSFTLSVTNPPACNAMTFTNQPNVSTEAAPAGMATGDFNGDGKTDLVVTNYEANSISVFINDGAGNWQTKTDYSVGQNPKFITVGDLNQDEIQDLIVANIVGGSITIFLGLGEGNFRTAFDIQGMDYPSSIALGDFNSDHKIDLVIANAGSYLLSVLHGNGDGTFRSPYNYYQGRYPVSVVAGDFNKDGADDFAVAYSVSNAATIFWNYGANYFLPVTFDIGIAPTAIVSGDFNADGWIDLAITNYDSDTITALCNDHVGGFRAPITFPVGKNPTGLAVADFNNDGSQDLAVLSQGDSRMSLLISESNNVLISFTNSQTINSNGSDTIVLADFNSDGQLDYAVANYWTNELITGVGTCVEAPATAIFRTIIFRQRERSGRLLDANRRIVP